MKRNVALKYAVIGLKPTQVRKEFEEFIQKRCYIFPALDLRDVLASVRISLQGRRNFHHLRKPRSRDRNKVGRMLFWIRAVIGRERSQD